jgi:anti-sigma factor RsiW
MDHDVVVRQKFTERYLLDELEPGQRDEFEEHLFDCRECADDVRAGAIFVARSKAVLAEEATPVPTSVRSIMPPRPAWWLWFRPAVMLPVLAMLLAFVGYQNLVTYPQLHEAVSRPAVLPYASLNVATYAAEGPAITVAPGKGFLLFVRIPPDGAYDHYLADLYNPAGKLEWSLTIPALTGQDQWPVEVPGANREAGSYALKVRGVTAAGESKEVGQTSFALQIQK